MHSDVSSVRARAQSGCVVCGQENPHGLRIHFRLESDGIVSAEWRPSANWEGFEGILHGGIISTVLDEAMSKAVAAMNYEALTVELRVRFRRHVAAGENLQIRGWVVEKIKRLLRTEATLTSSDGTERAHAWANFLALPGHIPPYRESENQVARINQGESQMKIAIPTDDGINISAHFGRCREFLIFEAGSGQVKLVDSRANAGCHPHVGHSTDGAGQNHNHSGFVEALKDCGTVLCSGIGAGAIQALRRAEYRWRSSRHRVPLNRLSLPFSLAPCCLDPAACVNAGTRGPSRKLR